MSDEELIARLRDMQGVGMLLARAAAKRIEALVEALKWIEVLDDHAECCGQPEYGLDRAKRVARNARAALKGDDQ